MEKQGRRVRQTERGEIKRVREGDRVRDGEKERGSENEEGDGER